MGCWVRAVTVLSVDMVEDWVVVGELGSSLPTADASVNLDGEMNGVRE